mmetsp:Transcript_33605/g.41443  ORF Transcript_33605/g.41443 Transcript_33605/m.41443 type:complete len:295 (+) Transcript_33605:501-1385(+)
MVAVGARLHEDGSVLHGVGTGPLDGLLHHEHVLALYLEAWDLVTALVEVSVVRRSLLRSAHTVGVVLAKVDDGELPETSHVGSLEELALVGRTVAVHSNGEVLLATVLLGEGEAGADGELGAHDTVTTIEVALSVVVVHGATLAHGGAGLFTHHLGHDSVGSVATGESLAMVAVGSDEAVLARHTGLTASSDGLLTVVKMAESANLSLLVQLIGEDLHAAHLSHLVEQSAQFFFGHGGLARELACVHAVGADDFGEFEGGGSGEGAAANEGGEGALLGAHGAEASESRECSALH